MPKSLIIQAYNIHQGGGKSQLLAILSPLGDTVPVKVFVDQRLDFQENKYKNIRFIYVKPKIMHRLKVEFWLYRNASVETVVLCFGNLPPLFRLKSYVIVFLQNKYLIEKISLSGFCLKTKLRIVIERLWFSWKSSNANEYVVQTPSMKNILSTKVIKSINMLPFVNDSAFYNRSASINKVSNRMLDYDFIYVASGDSHKNHKRLINAWILLCQEGVNPSLCITIDECSFNELYSWIEQKKKMYALNITNIGVVEHERVKSLFHHVGALIYPSTFESFGLPLIEARQANLTILASELNFVRDIVDPEQSFDPYSSVSIARAIKRHLNLKEPKLPLLSATEFTKYLAEKVRFK